MAGATATTMTIRRAARRVKKDPKTVWKWIKYGLSSPTGGTIKLAAHKVGREWLIDPADLDKFSRQLTESALQGTS